MRPVRRAKGRIAGSGIPEILKGSEALAALLDECKSKRDEIDCAKPADCWYRGQSDASWRLTPGLFRDLEVTGPWASLGKRKRALRSKKVRDRETDLFWEAFTQARQFHESNLDGWDVLFIMQHHAFPTRLLDWTETLATALYFAVCDLAEDVSRTAAIWILNPERLNNESWNKEDVGLIDPRNLGWDGKLREYFDYRDYMTEELRDDYSKGPVAIYPAQKSERMRAQAGRFTIHGRELAPLDEIYGPRSGVWRKVEVPCEAVQRAKEFLDISGVTEYRLFPDLDGLGRHLRTKYAVGPKVR